MKYQFLSHSLNQVHMIISTDYSQNPQQKVSFLVVVFWYSLDFVSSQRMLPFDIWPSFPVTTWMFP